MESKLTLDRVEYSCKGNNKTMIFIKKDFLNEAFQKATLKLLQPIHSDTQPEVFGQFKSRNFLSVKL